MRKTKMTKLLAVLLVVCMMSTSVVGGTLAAYTSEVTGTGTVTVAKWGISFKDGSSTATADFDISVSDTKTAAQTSGKDENALVAEGVIAPGDTGSFFISLTDGGTAVSTQVAYTYSIEIANDDILPIAFYTDSSYETEWTDVYGIVQENETIGSTYEDMEIFWQWDPNLTDEQDTALGLAAAAVEEGETYDLEFTVTMSATQILDLVSDEAGFEGLGEGSDQVVYVDDLTLSSAETWTNETFDGTVIFGAISSTNTDFTVTATSADIIFAGNIDLGEGELESSARSDTTVFQGAVVASNIKIAAGSVRFESSATAAKVTIPETNTTITSVKAINSAVVDEVVIASATAAVSAENTATISVTPTVSTGISASDNASVTINVGANVVGANVEVAVSSSSTQDITVATAGTDSTTSITYSPTDTTAKLVIPEDANSAVSTVEVVLPADVDTGDSSDYVETTKENVTVVKSADFSNLVAGVNTVIANTIITENVKIEEGVEIVIKKGITLTVDSGAVLTNIYDTITNNGTIDNDGVILGTVNGTISGTGIVYTSAWDGSSELAEDTNKYIVTNMSLNIDAGNSNTYAIYGSLFVAPGATLTFESGGYIRIKEAGSIVNYGTVINEGYLYNSGVIVNNGTYTNNGSTSSATELRAGVFIGSADGSKTIGCIWYKNIWDGSTDMSAYDELAIMGNWEIESDFTVPENVDLYVATGAGISVSENATLTLSENSRIINQGTLAIDGTLVNNGDITNVSAGAASNNGTIENNGYLVGTGVGLFEGTITGSGINFTAIWSGRDDVEVSENLFVTSNFATVNSYGDQYSFSVYGNLYISERADIEIIGSRILTVAEGATLVIAKDAILVNSGTLINEVGTVDNKGEIQNDGIMLGEFSGTLSGSAVLIPSESDISEDIASGDSVVITESASVLSDVEIAGALTISDGGALTILSGTTVIITGDKLLINEGGQLILQDGASILIKGSGILRVASGGEFEMAEGSELTVEGSTSYSFYNAGTVTNNGTIIFQWQGSNYNACPSNKSGGVLTNNGTITTYGYFANNSGAVFNNYGTFTVMESSTFTTSDGAEVTTLSAIMRDQGTFNNSGKVQMDGTWEIKSTSLGSSTTFTNAVDAKLIVNGDFVLEAYVYNGYKQTIENYGEITFNNNSTFTIDGDINNYKDAVITLNGTATLGDTLTNYGTLNNGGELTLNVVASYSKYTYGTINNMSTGVVNNTGTINNTGYIVGVGTSSIVNDGEFNDDGIFDGNEVVTMS